MKHLAAIALIAVTTLFAASSPSGASNSSTRVVLSTTGTWAFRGLSPAERASTHWGREGVPRCVSFGAI